MKHIYTNKGVTIIELLIIVSIISILALLVFPNIKRAKINSNEANAQVTLKAISTSLEIFNSSNNHYPFSVEDLLLIKYFSDTHKGYVFSGTVSRDTYNIVATPISENTGIKIYSISTGAIIKEL